MKKKPKKSRIITVNGKKVDPYLNRYGYNIERNSPENKPFNKKGVEKLTRTLLKEGGSPLKESDIQKIIRIVFSKHLRKHETYEEILDQIDIFESKRKKSQRG